MKQHKKIILYLILLIFLSIKTAHILTQKGISWDSAVYIEMGKYIFSSAKAGLWEPSRPLIWPILLGILWKIKLDPILFGELLGLILSIGCICLTYLIGKEIFNENIALLSAFFLAFSPTFIFHSSTILTGIPSTFFALLSIHFLIKEKYFLTGLSVGLSFMTRFLQLFILIPILLAVFLHKKKQLKSIMNLAYGLLIITLPYLILNTFLYKDPIYPFVLQVFMSKYTGWVFHQPFNYYFINLLKENFLILFSLIGAITILKKREDHKKLTILGIFLLFLIFFSSIAHKEMRFVIVFLPYAYLITSYGFFKLFKITRKIKNFSLFNKVFYNLLTMKNGKKLFYLLIILIGIFWLITEIPQIKTPSYKEYPEFADYLKTTSIKGKIWVSNPVFIANSNKKADELIYYPLYNSKKIDTLKTELYQAGHILIDTCDILPCPPADKGCPDKTASLLSSLKNSFKTIYYKKEGSCEQFIFEITS